MSEYYAVIRSDSELAHYGVKGMKWGVRKALAAKGNRGERKLARQYKKAARKLARLNVNADVNMQRKIAEQQKKISKIAGRVGVAGLSMGVGSGAGSALLSKSASKIARAADAAHRKNSKGFDKISSDILRKHDKKFRSDWGALSKKVDSRGNRPYEVRDIRQEQLAKNAIKNHTAAQEGIYSTYKQNRVSENAAMSKAENRLNAAKTLNKIQRAAGGIGAVGLGISAGAAIMSKRAKNLTTAKGHAKAVAKRDAWKKQMQSAFKGTQYANLPIVQKTTKRRKK